MVRLNKINGYTITELLVVIVIIGVLAAVSVVAYIGIASRAIQASVLTDLDGATKQIKQYQGIYGNGKYPVSVNDCPNPANGNICLKSSGSNKFSYKVYNTTKPKDFRLTAYNESEGVYYSNNASEIRCPLNFVIVPGSSLYGTKDFCAMKYEAKQASATVPVSKADGVPWVNVKQDYAGTNNDANDYSKNVEGCSGCHLITEAEWLTIAHDVLGVSSNFNTLSGYRYIYRGNSVNLGGGAIAASRNDSTGYYGMSTSVGDGAFYDSSHLYVTGDSQRRTLALSNGEIIWDISGNASEWTTGQAESGRPGKVGQTCNAADGATYVQWINADASPVTLAPNPSPLFMTDIPGIDSMISSNGIGMLCSDPVPDWSRGMVRGGSWPNGIIAGVMSLTIYQSPNSGSQYIGFRAAR